MKQLWGGVQSAGANLGWVFEVFFSWLNFHHDPKRAQGNGCYGIVLLLKSWDLEGTVQLRCVATLEVKQPENTSIPAYSFFVCVNDSTHIPCKLASFLNSAQFTAKLVAPHFIPNTVMAASRYFRIRVFRPSLFEDVYLPFSSFSPSSCYVKYNIAVLCTWKKLQCYLNNLLALIHKQILSQQWPVP